MKFFKFDWFRSEERKQLDVLKLRAQEIKNSLLEEKVNLSTPYKKLIYSNGNITVVMPKGVILNQKGVDSDMYAEIKRAQSEGEIIEILKRLDKVIDIHEKYTEEETKFVASNINILRNNPEFEFRQGKVFLKGVNLELPPAVLGSFIELEEKAISGLGDTQEKYQTLKMFWLKLATSPSKESREQVLSFCKENDIQLSKRGNIIAYRRIKKVKKQEKSLLEQFVNSHYDRIKGWKKSPASYFVWLSESGSYILSKSDIPDGTSKLEGNLAELKVKVNTPTETEDSYTSYHNSGKYIFKIGDVYKADEGDIDTNAGNCASGGLHFAAVSYDYSGFGDTPIVVLVNPAKTITIPLSEMQKGRTTEMKIVGINPNDHGVHIDEDFIEKADQEYNEFTIDQLEEALRTKDFSELCAEEEVPVINLVDLSNITKALRERVVNI